MYLKDGDWKNANDYCEKVLDIESENAEAYLGKLLAQLRVKREKDLKNSESPFDGNANYEKNMWFGSDELKTRLEGYNRFITERNEAEKLKKNITTPSPKWGAPIKALNISTPPICLKRLLIIRIRRSFMKNVLRRPIHLSSVRVIIQYWSLWNKTRNNDMNDVEKTLNCFEQVRGYENADEHIENCKEVIQEIERELNKKRVMEETALRKIHCKVVIRTFCIFVVLAIILVFAALYPKIRYNKAVELYKTGVTLRSWKR